MPRPRPTFAPVDPEPAPADVCRDGALSVGDAVRFSGVGRTTLYAAMSRGELVWLEVGRRRLVPRAALAAWLARHIRGRIA